MLADIPARPALADAHAVAQHRDRLTPAGLAHPLPFAQYQGAIDVAYLDPPYNTGKKDSPYSDRRFHDPNADADDIVYGSLPLLSQ